MSTEVINIEEIKHKRYDDEWNMELFNNYDVIVDSNNEGIDNKITKVSTNKAILDFTKNAFPIKRVAYAITDTSKNADPNNKYLRGYIDIEDIFGLQGELDNIFYKNDLVRNNEASKELLEEIKNKSLYIYKGKFVDKDTNTLYCRWFSIKPAKNPDTVFLTVTSMKGKENETGLVVPIEKGSSISINVSYFDLKKIVNTIAAEYTAYLTYSYFGKQPNFIYNK